MTEETFADLTLPRVNSVVDLPYLLPYDPSLSWSPDGQDIIFVNYSQTCKCTAAMVYDRLTSTLRTLRPRARDARMSPDGKWLSPSGGFPARVEGLEWSPDSREIAFASDADGSWRVFAVDVAGGPIVPMSPSGMEAALPKWRP